MIKSCGAVSDRRKEWRTGIAHMLCKTGEWNGEPVLLKSRGGGSVYDRRKGMENKYCLISGSAVLDRRKGMENQYCSNAMLNRTMEWRTGIAQFQVGGGGGGGVLCKTGEKEWRTSIV